MAYDDAIREYEARKALYEELGKVVETILRKAVEQAGIPYQSITSRPKDPKKLKRKIERAVLPYTDPLRQITDLAGVRIITYFPRDIDEITKLVFSSFSVDEENSVDKRKISSPDRFGYMSLQYVVQLDPVRKQQIEYKRLAELKCEIQIRTILQHAWAEIEHDLEYKSETNPPEIRRRFAALSALLEIADREFEDIRRQEEELRKRVAASLSEDKLKIPIDMVSLPEYLKNKMLGKYSLAGIPPRELSDLISDMRAMRIDDLETLDEALGRFDLKLDKLEKNLKELTGYDVGLHPAGMVRVVLARAYPEEFKKAMEAKLASTEGRVREFNSRITSAILRLVTGS